MKKLLIRLQGVMIYTLIVVLVMLIICSVASHIIGRDDPSVNDADMQITRIEIPNEQNAWYYFEKAAREFNPAYDMCETDQNVYTTRPVIMTPDGKPTELTRQQNKRSNAMQDKAYEIIDSEPWQNDEAKTLIEQNQKVLHYFDKALTCEKSLVPKLKYEIDSPQTIPLRYLTNLSNIRSKILFNEGKEKQAFDSAMKTVRFGWLIESSNGQFINFLIGAASKARGLNQIQKFLTTTTLRSKQLKNYITTLEQYRSATNSWNTACKHDYQHFKNMSKAIPQYGNKTTKLFFPHFFLPNYNQNTAASFYRIMMANGQKPYEKRIPLEDYKYSNVFKLYVNKNSTGQMLITISAPSLEGIVRTKSRTNNILEKTRTLIALKCYQLDNGELPKSLGQLIPNYLSEVPIDDLNGKPLQYNPKKEFSDCVDDGIEKKNQDSAYISCTSR